MRRCALLAFGARTAATLRIYACSGPDVHRLLKPTLPAFVRPRGHAQTPAILDLAARWWLRGTKKMPRLRGACRGFKTGWETSKLERMIPENEPRLPAVRRRGRSRKARNSRRCRWWGLSAAGRGAHRPP